MWLSHRALERPSRPTENGVVLAQWVRRAIARPKICGVVRLRSLTQQCPSSTLSKHGPYSGSGLPTMIFTGWTSGSGGGSALFDRLDRLPSDFRIFVVAAVAR